MNLKKHIQLLRIQMEVEHWSTHAYLHLVIGMLFIKEDSVLLKIFGVIIICISMVLFYIIHNHKNTAKEMKELMDQYEGETNN